MRVLHYFMVLSLGMVLATIPCEVAAQERNTKNFVASQNIQIEFSSALERIIQDNPSTETVPVLPPVPLNSTQGTPPLSPASLPVPDVPHLPQGTPENLPSGVPSESSYTAPLSIIVMRPQGSALALTSSQLIAALSAKPSTEQELTDYSKALVQSDDRIQKIEIGLNEISFTYRHTAKLFGFVPVSFDLRSTTDTSGVVRIHRPFWLFLAADSARSLRRSLNQEIHGTRNAPMNGSTSETTQDTNEESVAFFYDLLNTMYSAHKVSV